MKFNKKIYSYCLIIVTIIFLYNMITTILSFNGNNEATIISNVNNNIFLLFGGIIVSIGISLQSDKNYFIYKFREKVSKRIYTKETDDKNIYMVSFNFNVKEDFDRILIRDVICYFDRRFGKIVKYDYRDGKNIHFDEEEKKIIEEIIGSQIKIAHFRIIWIEKIIKIIAEKYNSIFEKENEYSYKMKEYRLR